MANYTFPLGDDHQDRDDERLQHDLRALPHRRRDRHRAHRLPQSARSLFNLRREHG